jgi:hypothetical protein
MAQLVRTVPAGSGTALIVDVGVDGLARGGWWAAFRLTVMSVTRSLLLFGLAAVAEIGGRSR